MVQYFQSQKTPSWIEALGQGLGQGFSEEFSEGQKQKRLMQQMQEQERLREQGMRSQAETNYALEQRKKAPLYNLLSSMAEDRITDSMNRQKGGVSSLADSLGEADLSQQLGQDAGQMRQEASSLQQLSKELSPQEQFDQLLLSVPPHLAALDENIGKQREAALKRQEEKMKRDLEERKFSLEEKKYYEKEPKEFYGKLQEQAEKLPSLDIAIDEAEQAIKSGKLEGFNRDWFAEKFNVPQFSTVAGKTLKTAVKQFLTQGKDLFGARPSNYDVQILEQMFPRIGENKYASLAALETQKFNRDVLRKKRELADEMVEKGGYSKDLQRKVNKELEEYTKKRRIESLAQIELLTAAQGGNVDYRYLKQTLPADEVIIIKDGKPQGTSNKKHAEALRAQGYEIIVP